LEDSEEISKVLFELSSNRRANLLFEIQKDNLKMQQLSKNLDMTVTETFRHLQRLTDAKLVEKKVDGTYAITSLGNLATGFLKGFNFVLKNTDFFLEHDISFLPYEFVNRVGELSAASFCKEPIVGFNAVRKMVFEAEKFIWTIAEQVDSSHIQPTKDKVAKGLEFRILMQQYLAKSFAHLKEPGILKGSRYLQRISVTLVINENEASLTFRNRKGVMDYMGMHGSDEKFCKWCKDLFLYYWEKAEHWYPGIQIS